MSDDPGTVTVHHKRQRFTVAFSRLPGRTFGPFSFPEAVRSLRISALLSPANARNLVMDAAVDGQAGRAVDDGSNS